MMLRYLARRLLHAVPVVIGVTLISFLLIHLIPGDPARTMLGPKALQSAIDSFRFEHGLNEPLLLQYFSFIKHLLTGNLGNSLYYGMPNSELILERMPVTVGLLVLSSIMALLIAAPLAMGAAARRGRTADSTVRVATSIGLGVPSFWMGLILLIIFAIRIPLFPSGGYGSNLMDQFKSLVLPSLTIALGLSPLLVRSLRAEIIGALDSDFVMTARAKGVSPGRVMTRHALRNALGPTVTVLVINIGALVAGSVVVESVFALPGLGSLLTQSITNRDFSTVQALTLVFALMVIAINIANDVFQSLQDRRIILSSH